MILRIQENEKRLEVFGRPGRSKTDKWLTTKGKRQEALDKIDRTKIKAAIWLDQFLIEDSWCPECEGVEGEICIPKDENANKVVHLLQAALRKPTEEGQICKCEKILISQEEWSCDESGLTFYNRRFGFLIKSNMHNNEVELWQDVFAKVFEIYALNSKFFKVCENTRLQAGSMIPHQIHGFKPQLNRW